MSLVFSKNNTKRELKLKIAKTFHDVNNIHAELFSAQNLMFYNNALGRNRLEKRYMERKKINLQQSFFFGIIASLGGTHMLTQDPSSIFGLVFLLWGISISVMSFWIRQSSDDELNENYEILKNEIEELKKDVHKFRNK